ncbi:MAG: hypothetical protein U0103_13835 [Candidatus Obscuribacterales bacterium]
MDPEDHFALLAGGLLDLPERLIPVQRRCHSGDAVVRGLTAQVSGLPGLRGHTECKQSG